MGLTPSGEAWAWLGRALDLGHGPARLAYVAAGHADDFGRIVGARSRLRAELRWSPRRLDLARAELERAGMLERTSNAWILRPWGADRVAPRVDDSSTILAAWLDGYRRACQRSVAIAPPADVTRWIIRCAREAAAQLDACPEQCARLGGTSYVLDDRRDRIVEAAHPLTLAWLEPAAQIIAAGIDRRLRAEHAAASRALRVPMLGDEPEAPSRELVARGAASVLRALDERSRVR